MDNPAQVSDLTNRDYAGPASETARQTRLDEAWRGLRRDVPSLVERIGSGEIDTDDVVDVICAAALRVLRNPEGVESESGALDDYQESRKIADASADLYFTSAELRRLQPVATGSGDWSGSLRYC